MQSKFVDKAVVCAVCGQWISQGEPRKYNQQSRVSAHDECVGAKQMHDHYAPEAPPQPPASPERESREAAIERCHRENVDAYMAIADAIRSVKATLIETNTLLGRLTKPPGVV